MEFKNEVNAHHNYAAEEHHYGKGMGSSKGRYKGREKQALSPVRWAVIHI